MKYIVIATFNVEGHPESQVKVCDSAKQKKDFLKQLIWDEQHDRFYPAKNKYSADGGEIWYGDGPLGAWAIKIVRFTSYTSIINKTFGLSTE